MDEWEGWWERRVGVKGGLVDGWMHVWVGERAPSEASRDKEVSCCSR